MGSCPLVAHVIYRLGVGGMENGLVNLINGMPRNRYRHAIVCLVDFTDYRERIERADVDVIALGKKPGKDPLLYARLFRALKRLSPDIVHTRNLPALEGQWVGALAGVRGRVHGEHGRDVYDLHGRNWKYNVLRKAVRPFVGHYIAVSQDLERWLLETVRVPRGRVTQIYNGVDAIRFHPRAGGGPAPERDAVFPRDAIVVGSVGRMAAVKDYPTLVKAFVRLLASEPSLRSRLRLAIVGDGESREPCLELLREANAADLAWLPGERPDVPDLMSFMDVFVLPSLGEGISNTILEAMATGLPVVATAVGGNPELVEPGATGALVPPGDVDAMAAALRAYAVDPGLARAHGDAARAKIESRFSMSAMIGSYLRVYETVLEGTA